MANALDDRLAEAYCRKHPADAARAVERLPVTDAVSCYQALPPEVVAPVVALMDPPSAAAVVAALDRGRASALVGQLAAQVAGVLLRRLPAEARDEILAGLAPRQAAAFREVLRYASETAAALCDPGVLTVQADWTVVEAVEAVRRVGRAYYYVFALDRDQRLVGVVNLRDLLLAADDAKLTGLLRRDIAHLKANAGTAAILSHPAWRSLAALPVVDADGRFLGLLRHETVKQIESETAGGSMSQTAAGLAVELGELFWSAGGALIGELAQAVSGGPLRSSEGR